MVGGSANAATKGGIIALTRAVAAEEGAAGTGVRINCVSPGAIQTAMLDRVISDAKIDIVEWAKEKKIWLDVLAIRKTWQMRLFF